MSALTGGSFKRVSPSDIVTRKSNLNQLVDVIQEDVSGSATRRKYQVFVTGGVGPGVTSSLFQTVYDQDFTLQTSNAIFDMTVGLSSLSQVVTSSRTATDAATGKMLFPSQTLMMREKMDIYRQYAKTLLGNADSKFFAPITTTDVTDTNAAGDPNPDRIDDLKPKLLSNPSDRDLVFSSLMLITKKLLDSNKFSYSKDWKTIQK